MADASVPTSNVSSASRVQLKRWFLRTLVISLSTCAFVAVLALLVGTFNETTARILLTLGALALHSGVAMACSASLERRLWPGFSGFGLVAFGLNFCVLIACIWWWGGLGEPAARALLTTGTLLGYYIVTIPCADLYERRQYTPLAMAGLVVSGAGFLMQLVCIWSGSTENIEFGKATGIVAVMAFSIAHTCLLMRIPGGRALVWLLAGTLVSLWGVAVMAAVAIWFEPAGDLFYRFFGALGVTDACGTLTLLIMTKLRQVGKVEQLASSAPRVELRCPRCTAPQTVTAGKTKCGACGLKFTLEIEEPRCAKCGYLLWQLPERRCPECGTAF